MLLFRMGCITLMGLMELMMKTIRDSCSNSPITANKCKMTNRPRMCNIRPEILQGWSVEKAVLTISNFNEATKEKLLINLSYNPNRAKIIWILMMHFLYLTK